MPVPTDKSVMVTTRRSKHRTPYWQTRWRRFPRKFPKSEGLCLGVFVVATHIPDRDALCFGVTRLDFRKQNISWGRRSGVKDAE